MNIEEGYYDLMKFLDGNLYSSLEDLVNEDFIFADGATFDIYKGKFITDGDGIFAIEFVLIPEPSTYSIIFGLLAFAFAGYRRCK